MLQAKKVERQYKELLKEKNKPIKENSNVLSNLKWQKAINDLSLAEGLLKVSTSEKIKDDLGYSKNITFFDWVIVTSYYSIFHAAQALLGLKKIKISSRMHHATLIAFAKHFIVNGELEAELFLLYENAESKAGEMLDIFEEEKGKRGMFQYHRLSKNNLDSAKESVGNAKIFLEAVQEVLKKNNVI
jgi:uncharacterized protein (UPF0332 family)